MLAERSPIVTETAPTGFEPLRAETNGFLVHHVNHPATVSLQTCDSDAKYTIIPPNIMSDLHKLR